MQFLPEKIESDQIRSVSSTVGKALAHYRAETEIDKAGCRCIGMVEEVCTIAWPYC